MVIIDTIRGDLLASGAKYIAQQCNCVTVRGKGLSHSIAQKYPYANVYAQRATGGLKSKPGTIDLCTSTDQDDPTIICMYGQYYPGKTDKYDRRLQWFGQCLEQIEHMGITRVAMPYMIGCGLAGGQWADYQQKLQQSKLEIVLYRL